MTISDSDVKAYFERRHDEIVHPSDVAAYFNIDTDEARTICERLKDSGELMSAEMYHMLKVRS